MTDDSLVDTTWYKNQNVPEQMLPTIPRYSTNWPTYADSTCMSATDLLAQSTLAD